MQKNKKTARDIRTIRMKETLVVYKRVFGIVYRILGR